MWDARQMSNYLSQDINGNSLSRIYSSWGTAWISCSQPQEKIRVLIFNGGEEEFMASTPVKKITAGRYHGYRLVHHAQPHLPMPPDSKLASGEVYYLLPQLKLSCKKMTGEDDCGGRSIKIVVTKEQLEELMFRKCMMEFVSEEEFAVRVMESCRVRERCRKWRPSLATIPELQIC